MYRHNAQQQKDRKQGNWEILHCTVVKLRIELNHCNLPCETSEPKESEDDGDSVQLVVNQFVVLVDLEDKCVIDTVASKYLDGESCSEQYEADDRSDDVDVHRWE